MLLAGAESVSRSIIGKAGDFSLSESGKSLKQSYKLMVEYLLNIVIFKALQFFFYIHQNQSGFSLRVYTKICHLLWPF